MKRDLTPSSAMEMFDTAILTRVIAPDETLLSKTLAEEILRWDFTSDDGRRMAELSAKARAGSLSADEETEIDSYVRVGHIVNLLQAKARLMLKRASA
jgi:hypothetical protein